MGRELLGGIWAEWQDERKHTDIRTVWAYYHSTRSRTITEINVSWALIFCIIGGVILLAALLTGCATSF